MKNLIENENYIIILSRKLLDKIEICNGLSLRENILKELSERFYDPTKDKFDNSKFKNIEYLILIGIDADEVVLETITSVEISEELKELPAYPYTLNQYYTADRIVNCIKYLTYIAELEHKEWSDSLLLEKIFKDSKLNIDVIYETEAEFSFEEEFIQSKRLKAIRDFNSGFSPLNFYLSPSDISDGCSHKIEISQDYRISSINLGGALGESVARFGDIAKDSIRRYFEESYKWHDHLIWDVLVAQLNQTVNLYFKEYDQDLKSAFRFNFNQAENSVGISKTDPFAKFTSYLDGTTETCVPLSSKVLSFLDEMFFPRKLSFASVSSDLNAAVGNYKYKNCIFPVSYVKQGLTNVIEFILPKDILIDKVFLVVDGSEVNFDLSLSEDGEYVIAKIIFTAVSYPTDFNFDIVIIRVVERTMYIVLDVNS